MRRGRAARAALVACLAWVAAACSGRAVELAKALELGEVTTGWYDAGIVEGSKNKLVPTVSFKLRNRSDDRIGPVQLNAVFRRVSETEQWGDHFVRALAPDGLAPGATSGEITLRSNLGYTGTQPRSQMLQNREFVDATAEVYVKYGSAQWVKLGQFKVDRQLLTH